MTAISNAAGITTMEFVAELNARITEDTSRSSALTLIEPLRWNIAKGIAAAIETIHPGSFAHRMDAHNSLAFDAGEMNDLCDQALSSIALDERDRTNVVIAYSAMQALLLLDSRLIRAYADDLRASREVVAASA